MAAKYIDLTTEQKKSLLTYVGMSLALSVILSGAKVVAEVIELLPTLGIGSLTTDVVFAGLSEYLSSSFEKMADKNGVPHVKSSHNGIITSRVMNLIPLFSFVRFGFTNLVPALRGRVKI